MHKTLTALGCSLLLAGAVSPSATGISPLANPTDALAMAPIGQAGAAARLRASARRLGHDPGDTLLCGDTSPVFHTPDGLSPGEGTLRRLLSGVACSIGDDYDPGGLRDKDGTCIAFSAHANEASGVDIALDGHMAGATPG